MRTAKGVSAEEAAAQRMPGNNWHAGRTQGRPPPTTSVSETPTGTACCWPRPGKPPTTTTTGAAMQQQRTHPHAHTSPAWISCRARRAPGCRAMRWSPECTATTPSPAARRGPTTGRSGRAGMAYLQASSHSKHCIRAAQKHDGCPSAAPRGHLGENGGRGAWSLSNELQTHISWSHRQASRSKTTKRGYTRRHCQPTAIQMGKQVCFNVVCWGGVAAPWRNALWNVSAPVNAQPSPYPLLHSP
jgi:hypothetical protein